MKIGLIAVDDHNFPNLPLMKISSFYKKQGDLVEWCNPLLSYDKVYVSKVFDFTPDFNTCINSKDIIFGGTGYDLKNKLPFDIENIYPDYSLYRDNNTSYGFLTRGCPRNCSFCIVSKKEGCKSYQVADLNYFHNNQKYIKLLDPNILACKDSDHLLIELKNTKALIDFTQGLDIRFMDHDKINILNQIKIKMIHFAWDNYEFKTFNLLKEFRKSFKFSNSKLRVYVLVNYNTTIDQDLERIYKLLEVGYEPYIMIYNKDKAPSKIKDMARWINGWIFRKCPDFNNYVKGF